jgi:catechol-2,3-dioxygenase
MAVEFDHVAIESSSIEQDIAFFREVVPGLEALYQDSSWGLVSAAGVKLAFVSPAEHPPHVAFRVDSREELQAFAKRTLTNIEVHRDLSESLYLQAPGGAWIEVVYYPPKP